MSDIIVKICKGERESEIRLIDQGDGKSFKLDHPKADPDRIFYKNGHDESEVVLYALMHLTTRK